MCVFVCVYVRARTHALRVCVTVHAYVCVRARACVCARVNVHARVYVLLPIL